MAVPLSKLPSEPSAESVYPVAMPAEIVTRQLNEPLEETTAPQALTVAPLLIDVATVTAGVNPVPDTVTEAPLGPWVGARVISEAVIVNAALALSKPPSEPVAVTEYAVADGVPVIVTEQPNPPEPLTVASQLVIPAPDVIAVEIVTPSVNPLPVTVTVTPLGPWSGESVID